MIKLVAIFCFISVISARSLDPVYDGSVFGSEGFAVNHAIPLAEKIRSAEEANQLQQRITGGTPSILGQFPYQAGLVIEYYQHTGIGICGAALISSFRLTTAAHCWFDGFSQASKFTVVLGSTTIFYGGTRIETSEVVMHPGWDLLLTGLLNDIAVIYLSTPALLSSFVSPIGLPAGDQLNQDFVGAPVIASGFGLKYDGATIPVDQYISHVDLRVISNAECRTVYNPSSIHDSMLCTRGEPGRNICGSDAGGPLATISNNRSLLIGITSFGYGKGCELDMPSGFIRITSFIDFIYENL